jgi:hypothetical protein
MGKLARPRQQHSCSSNCKRPEWYAVGVKAQLPAAESFHNGKSTIAAAEMLHFSVTQRNAATDENCIELQSDMQQWTTVVLHQNVQREQRRTGNNNRTTPNVNSHGTAGRHRPSIAPPVELLSRRITSGVVGVAMVQVVVVEVVEAGMALSCHIVASGSGSGGCGGPRGRGTPAVHFMCIAVRAAANFTANLHGAGANQHPSAAMSVPS